MALPEVIRLVGDDNFDAAYRLAQQAQPYISDDPILAEQLKTVTRQAIALRSGRRRGFLSALRPTRRAVAPARQDAGR